MSQPSSSYADSSFGSQADPYKQKLKNLKLVAKDYIFLNAALCDQVSDTQERLVIAKEKRRFLTEKLYQIRAQLEQDNQLQTNKPIQQLVVSPQQLFTSTFEEDNGRRITVTYPQFVSDDESLKPAKKKAKPKKAAPIAGPSRGKKIAEPAPPRAQQSLLTHSYVKQEVDLNEHTARYKLAGKSNTQVIQVDSNGLPEYPIYMDELTIYSLGNFDYNDSYDEESPAPVGYCAARVYVSMNDMYSKCTYFCKVLDNGGESPSYVIDYEDYDNKKIPLVGKTANECVAKLMHYVNKAIGFQIVKPARGLGEKFFGLSNPAVKDLIKIVLQSDNLPEPKHGMTIALGPDEKVDETLNFDALQNRIAYYNFDFENMDVAEEVLDAY